MVDIELLAVNAVENRVSRTGRLKAQINVNDKKPICDGGIFVYEDNSKTNKSFKGKIPIKVKGKKVLKIENEDKIKYSVETVNLRNYCRDGGVMYFVG